MIFQKNLKLFFGTFGANLLLAGHGNRSTTVFIMMRREFKTTEWGGGGGESEMDAGGARKLVMQPVPNGSLLFTYRNGLNVINSMTMFDQIRSDHFRGDAASFHCSLSFCSTIY